MRVTHRTTANTRPPTQAQRGVSLIVILMFLLAITGVAVFAARNATLGEGTARNQLDMETARQAAESALRDAERDLSHIVLDTVNASCIRPQVLIFDTACTTGLCRFDGVTYATSNWDTATQGSTVNSEPWWPNSKGGLWNDNLSQKPSRTPINTSNCGFTGGVPLGTFTGATAIRGVALQPEYLIEYFQKKVIDGQEADTYRITARGFGYTRRTQVVLQSVFVVEE